MLESHTFNSRFPDSEESAWGQKYIEPYAALDEDLLAVLYDQAITLRREGLKDEIDLKSTELIDPSLYKPNTLPILKPQYKTAAVSFNKAARQQLKEGVYSITKQQKNQDENNEIEKFWKSSSGKYFRDRYSTRWWLKETGISSTVATVSFATLMYYNGVEFNPERLKNYADVISVLAGSFGLGKWMCSELYHLCNVPNAIREPL